MTGFSRSAGALGDYGWTWELRSVNAKGLDTRVRLPTGLERLEGAVRERIAAQVKRGAINATLSLDRATGSERLVINEAALEQALALGERYVGKVAAGPPRLETLLTIRGIVDLAAVQESEETQARRDAAMLASLDEAVARLLEARAAEGARLATFILAHSAKIAALATAAARIAADQPLRVRARLEEQLRLLRDAVPPVSEERLAQEVALLAARADVREEIDRLNAHCEAAEQALRSGGVIGRQLDFLSQEFNREANTLCSKSADVELTRIGLELKGAIEQFREQVQNIE
jgi:uncharacterized protein (TIGR00255 family)